MSLLQRYSASCYWHTFLCLLALFAPVCLSAQAAPQPVPVVTPTDPVHLGTLRTYFDEIHYGSCLCRTWAASYAEQMKSRPTSTACVSREKFKLKSHNSI
jgi:hypothetical protein